MYPSLIPSSIWIFSLKNDFFWSDLSIESPLIKCQVYLNLLIGIQLRRLDDAIIYQRLIDQYLELICIKIQNNR